MSIKQENLIIKQPKKVIMKVEELMIGNYVKIDDLPIEQITLETFATLKEFPATISVFNPIPLTDEWLLKLGFDKIPNKTYINGFKYFLHTEGLNLENYYKDGTWFDGIGTIQNNGDLVVNILCRGNYVCNSVQYVHQLQNLYYALTSEQLISK